GKSSVSVGRRQVMQTITVAAASISVSVFGCCAISANATRAAPSGKTSGSGAVRGWLSGEPAALRTSSRHPARRATEPTVGLLASGSLPVTAFPGLTQWPVVRARRLQLRGQLRTWDEVPHRIPCWLFRWKETVDWGHKRQRHGLCQRRRNVLRLWRQAEIWAKIAPNRPIGPGGPYALRSRPFHRRLPHLARPRSRPARTRRGGQKTRGSAREPGLRARVWGGRCPERCENPLRGPEARIPGALALLRQPARLPAA